MAFFHYASPQLSCAATAPQQRRSSAQALVRASSVNAGRCHSLWPAAGHFT